MGYVNKVNKIRQQLRTANRQAANPTYSEFRGLVRVGLVRQSPIIPPVIAYFSGIITSSTGIQEQPPGGIQRISARPPAG